jgi:hypothetical protein
MKWLAYEFYEEGAFREEAARAAAHSSSGLITKVWP